MTDIKKWEVVEFLMTKLEPVNLEGLGPGKRLRTIYLQEFHVFEHVRLSHAPVKYCGHILGKPCHVTWLDPLCYGIGVGRDNNVVDKSSPKRRVEPLEYFKQNLSLFGTWPTPAWESHDWNEKGVLENICGSTLNTVIQSINQHHGRLEYDMAQV